MSNLQVINVNKRKLLTLTPIILGICSPSGPNQDRAVSVQGPQATTNASASIVVPSSSLTPQMAPFLSKTTSMTFPMTSFDPTDC